ncbi:baculoviral IAP repeat-containing protein 7-B-like isoform X2 [Dreissena polymorpha]|uniref:baculoviral IAP repeat-containing protein 7-B-like isoform X2 n=1 Tax=Dreissena polymorpha TaxID=45954 RepID=UPI002264839F|nr:baculoviral IAP repeat-containing protein 7-B-like isoform X2 [Dreissena polymorpha]XP_052285720.1 baculoviral IAP repeat-containing protein 7-B-like isoform X2 [Dreissena polymorpha]
MPFLHCTCKILSLMGLEAENVYQQSSPHHSVERLMPHIQFTSPQATHLPVTRNYWDEVRCFHCGKTLDNWSPNDNPWIVHARFSPDCTYMELNPEWTSNFRRIHRPHELLPQQPQDSLSVQTPPDGQCQAERALDGHCRQCHLQPSTVLLQPCGHWVHDICKDCAISSCECPICRQGVVKKSF